VGRASRQGVAAHNSPSRLVNKRFPIPTSVKVVVVVVDDSGGAVSCIELHDVFHYQSSYLDDATSKQ
jgi:hypothetical protein